MSATPLTSARWYLARARLFGLDLRAVAVFRILAGLLLLASLVDRGASFEAFYTSNGILPLDELLTGDFTPYPLEGVTFFYPAQYIGDTNASLLLFALGGLGVLGLVLGKFSNWACLAGWLSLVGLDLRNPLITNGGDDLIRMMFFWALFLPLGARWSLDARRTDHVWNRRRSNAYVSWGTFGFLVQFLFMYVFTALFKSYQHWVVQADALHYALNLEHFVTPLGEWARDVMPLTLASKMTWWVELLVPVFVFCPIATGKIRYLLFALFAGLHLGIDLCLDLGLFSYVCLAVWLTMLPKSFWDRVERFVVSRHWALRIAPPKSDAAAGWSPSGAVAGFCLAYFFAWNVWSLSWREDPAWFPEAVRAPGMQLKLNQFWAMFSPHPPHSSVWLDLTARSADGRSVQLDLDGHVRTSPRPRLSAWLTERWRKWMERVIVTKHTRLPNLYARFLLERAKESDPALVSVEIDWFDRPTPEYLAQNHVPKNHKERIGSYDSVNPDSALSYDNRRSRHDQPR